MKNTMPKTSKQQRQVQVGGKQKVIILVILVAAFLLVTSWTYFLGKKSAHDSAAPQPVVNAVVALSSPSTTVAVREPFDVTLTLNSEENGVDAADFVVMYNQASLQLDTVKEGEYFKIYPSKSGSGGLIKLSGVAFFENNKLVIPKGSGTVAMFSFTPLKTGNTTIRIDTQKTIIASGGKNILDASKIGDLTIAIL